MAEREYLIALNSFVPFGPARTKLLVSYFGDAKKAFLAGEEKILETGLGANIARDFFLYRKNFDIDKFFQGLKNKGINVVSEADNNYPINLKGLEDAPPVLYVRGNLAPEDINSIAVVGSRHMTYYGREVTQKLSGELAALGVTIVSGLAFGIDLEAHKAALSLGGRCIAVLASGIDLITPRSNEWLGREILGKGGAIVSEYPPGVVPQKYFFPFRNRIISGLSRAVVVIEGQIKSGTIHTANHAAAQGRTVYAVPGQITSINSQAPHYLIKNGAKMATSVEDILEEFSAGFKISDPAIEKIMPGDKKQEEIVKILQKEELFVDEIARIMDLKVSDVSAKLTAMELKGLVKNIGGGKYKAWS